MALIDCPECGSEVSQSAVACPRCAYPVAKRGGPSRDRIRRSGATPGSALEVTKSIVGRVILGAVFFASGVAWDAPPVVLGSLVVFGSTIPVWIKAKRAERFGGMADPKRVAELEQRMADLEERSLQQIADVEDQSSRQIAELEDRLDFTERLLTKQREQA